MPITLSTRPASVKFLRRSFSLLLCMSLGILSAQADTFEVNSVFDAPDVLPGNGVCETAPGNNTCTIRAAIQEANALAGTDTIEIPAGTFILDQAGKGEDVGTTGDLDIRDDVVITGQGIASTIIDANFTDRIFDITNVGAVIENLTIQNGKPEDSSSGGGIFISTADPVTLNRLLIRDCSADGNFDGGGIYIAGGGLTEIIESTISGNTALRGAGIYFNGGSGLLTITSSTLSQNEATLYGGGMLVRGPLDIVNSTISGNRAADFGG